MVPAPQSLLRTSYWLRKIKPYGLLLQASYRKATQRKGAANLPITPGFKLPTSPGGRAPSPVWTTNPSKVVTPEKETGCISREAIGSRSTVKAWWSGLAHRLLRGGLTGLTSLWTNEKRKKCGTRKLAAPVSKWCGTPINCHLKWRPGASVSVASRMRNIT
ncbi:hypothetical protein BKA56DRAFT_623808 [Ilyonectria sp. MPI-CAGE-AT-0026]|nr:hypothetical protein BKA56DRAFT_623808 [Ilyonectria sp. MPI-CAGE-AT-0026]